MISVFASVVSIFVSDSTYIADTGDIAFTVCAAVDIFTSIDTMSNFTYIADVADFNSVSDVSAFTYVADLFNG